ILRNNVSLFVSKKKKIKRICSEGLIILKGLFISSTYIFLCYFVAPNEEKNLPKFNMHHTAASTVTYVDSDIVKNFGFMPQDILGRSVFDFYHPEDMPLLKEVYEAALSQCQIAGAVYRSKPYRFAVQNGGFATIETDWSCFFNPWSRKLEIVIGMHNILKGPSNPDVFGVCKEKEINSVSEEILKKGDIVREEILRLLNHLIF
ncbi:period circadian protein-like, partial [Agrilus planipennis]|uniref:Period circadian protein n=1 Tax=Agrilus planipennis TaxID=224129 RepID=A0A7F5REH9_AGRPL